MILFPRRCERCEGEIPVDRIEVLPDTTICTKCSQAIGGEYRLEIVPDSVGKASSMKKNYGVYSMKKTRKTIRPIAPQE